MNLTRLVTTLLIMGIFSQAMSAQDVGIPYQKEPRENLTVGGQPSLEQLKTLQERGYTTIINLRREGEFDDFDEADQVAGMGMEYVHIPIKDVKSIKQGDARALHQAISNATGPVLLHCTVGWRAGGLFAIENYLLHDASVEEALELAAQAHMAHAVGDVEEWIQAND